MRMNPHKAGMALGILFGFIHLIWALMVATGLAGPFMDFALGLHFLRLQVSLEDFSVVTAIGLVATAVVSGYLAGFFFAHIWNRVGR